MPSIGELPPRARRIHFWLTDSGSPLGTTSACAENTRPVDGHDEARWNYLRVRGEYVRIVSEAAGGGELPPRARRIHPISLSMCGLGGTTSACAENTWPHQRGSPAQWNYLRVRGEYPTDRRFNSSPWELPPRARRIPYFAYVGDEKGGTTSACAENTDSYNQ